MDMEHQDDLDTPPASPPPPMEDDEKDSAPPPPAAGVVMPLTKEAIENFLRCQLDTHLNDATPRDRKDEELERKQESWQLPPGLQKHSSAPKSKRGEPAKEETAHHPAVPGVVVDETNEAEQKEKLEAQRVALLQRRLADQEKQTKMLLDRLHGRSSNPTAQTPTAIDAHAISMRRGRDRDQKHRFEQVLIEKANRAKQKVADSSTRARQPRDSIESAADGLEASPRAHSATRGRTRSRSGSLGSADERLQHSDSYSRDRAVDSIERSDATPDSNGQKAELKKKRSKNGKDASDLGAVDEQSKVMRTPSGTEIDLETGLPVSDKKSGGFSWFYAIGFILFLGAVTYATTVILQRV